MSSPPDHTTFGPDPTSTLRRVEGVRSFSGQALRQARIDRGLSHDALGLLTGQLRPNLIAWEQGRHQPTPRLLVVLARALGLDPLALLDVTGDTATLADLRARAGLSIVEVAGVLEVHPTTYWRIERGQGPLSETVAAGVAAVLGVPVELVVAAYSRVRGADR
jgi:transcriptional regulator with XRE-family HTH domain